MDRSTSGLSIDSLKKAHIRLFPVNMRLADRFTFDIVCVPMLNEETKQVSWTGEVLRKVTYKSGVQKHDHPAFYRFDAEEEVWHHMQPFESEEFEDTLRSFDREFGMLCVMKAEANYSTELHWQGVKNALHTGQVMGWISEEDKRKYCDHMENIALEKLKEARGPEYRHQDAEGGDLENSRQAISDFLHAHLVQRPRVVLATLSKLGIVDVHPMWMHFM